VLGIIMDRYSEIIMDRYSEMASLRAWRLLI
jgi:hypothetical protein